MTVMDDLAALATKLAQWMARTPSRSGLFAWMRTRRAAPPSVLCPRCRQRMQLLAARTDLQHIPGVPTRRSTWRCYTCFAEPRVVTWH